VDYILKHEASLREKHDCFNMDDTKMGLSRNPLGFVLRDEAVIMGSETSSFLSDVTLDPSAVLCLAGMINR
jgi:hypothetical protein